MPLVLLDYEDYDMTWVVGDFDAKGVKISVTVIMVTFREDSYFKVQVGSLFFFFYSTSQVLLSLKKESCLVLEVCASSPHLFIHWL